MARLYLWHGMDSTGGLQQGETLGRSVTAVQQQIMQQGCFSLAITAGQRINRYCWHSSRRTARSF